jgi:NAD(P)-dependent dehydrogenase (short-subunit alcohol dehydrogenase family)
MTGTVVVTGAAGTIGQAVLARLGERGHQTCGTVLPSQLDAVQVAGTGAVAMSVERADDVATAFGAIADRAGSNGIRAVVHLAAIEPPSIVELLDPAELRRVLDINVVGTLNVIQASLPLLRQSGGTLVVASSLWGMVSGPFVGAYAASKWATQALVDATRRETRGQGIKVSTINIGAVRSTMATEHLAVVERQRTALTDEQRQRYDKLFADHVKLNTVVVGKAATSPDKIAKRFVSVVEASRPRPSYRVGAGSRATRFGRAALSERALDRALGGKR